MTKTNYFEKQSKSLIDYAKTTTLTMIKKLEDDYSHIAWCLDEHIKERAKLDNQIKYLESKVYKGFSFNKKIRQKAKNNYKYLDKITISKLSEDEAKRLLKEAKKTLEEITYSYDKNVFY